MSIRGWSLVVACFFPAAAIADDVLYRYEAEVFPYDESAGWIIADSCDPNRICSKRLEDGRFILEWAGGTDIVNYHRSMPERPDTLWIEWRYRSNWPYRGFEFGCDGHFRIGGAIDNILMHGDAVMTMGMGAFLGGLELDAFRTHRFERAIGGRVTLSADGTVFYDVADDPEDVITYLQFRGLGECNRESGVVQRNEWDFIRYGTISDGEAIVASDPPAAIVDAVVYPDLDRFTITFDQPGYVYIDDVTVEVTGGDVPLVTQTRRLDNGAPETVEIVLDRPLTIGETTTFTFATGGTPNVVEYAPVLFGACCLPDGTCIETHPTDCVDQDGTFTADAECTSPRACCLPEGECMTADPVCCTASDGTPLAPAAVCEEDQDGDGVDAVCGDACPDDPNKTSPGQCGCGLPETDSDFDTVADCVDRCPGDDDHIDEDHNGVPDCLQFDPIPTTSEWGMAILALMLLTTAKILFTRRQTQTHR